LHALLERTWARTGINYKFAQGLLVMLLLCASIWETEFGLSIYARLGCNQIVSSSREQAVISLPLHGLA
jgi:hypothetical protein